jgi:hypothetical protein
MSFSSNLHDLGRLRWCRAGMCSQVAVCVPQRRPSKSCQGVRGEWSYFTDFDIFLNTKMRWRPPVGGREFVTQLFSHKTVRVWGRVGICTEWCCFFYSLAVTNEDILQSVFWLRSANNSALKRNKGEMLCAQHSPADQFARPNTSVIAHQVSI